MDVTARAALALVFALAGCGHARARTGGDHEASCERTAAIAADVVVHATRWDASLVEAAAADVRDREARAAVRERLHARYLAGGTAFTVLFELGHRPDTDDPLADPKAWWFALARGDDLVRARRVQTLAVDRFPAAGGGVHLRMAVLVEFDGPPPAGDLELRIGSEVRDGRRRLLGRSVARHGAPLRWRADASR